jgi:hypothetical protein
LFCIIRGEETTKPATLQLMEPADRSKAVMAPPMHGMPIPAFEYFMRNDFLRRFL